MSGDGIEVERKWVLRALPARILDHEQGRSDPAVTRMDLRQGYLRPATDEELGAFASNPTGPVRFGRIRSVGVEGRIRHVHTVKSGQGLVRREIEREIGPDAFEAAWPETRGRRITKVRWAVREKDGRIWEVDRFQGLDLLLAEVEVPDEAAAREVVLPGWLAAVVDREVTTEPAFTNAEIALQLGLVGGD